MRTLMSCYVAAIVCGYSFAAAACETPTMNVSMPDGKAATLEQMLTAQGQVKVYQAAMTTYLACIDGETAAQGEEAPAEFKLLMVERHNAAVAEMEGVAAAFNDQLKAYKAANPPAPK